MSTLESSPVGSSQIIVSGGQRFLATPFRLRQGTSAVRFIGLHDVGAGWEQTHDAAHLADASSPDLERIVAWATVLIFTQKDAIQIFANQMSAPAGCRLVVLEDATLIRTAPDAVDCDLLRRSADDPPVTYLLLNPRDAAGELVDEMETFETWQSHGPRYRVAFAHTRVAKLEALEAAMAAAVSGIPDATLGSSWVGTRELRGVSDAIQRRTLFRHYGLGNPKYCEQLEKAFRDRLEMPYALAVSSCSAALNCAMAALGIGPGDEVALPAFSWYSCYNSVVNLGATPVLCEIDTSLSLCPDDLLRRLTPRTRAVIVVHFQGGAARMREILAIARSRNLLVIEDCAQAIGATFEGRALGTLGDVGAYSFQANKILSSGEGGMLVCRDRRHFERAVRYHDLGFVRPIFQKQTGPGTVTPPFPGNQYRMSEVTAAIALAQMSRLDWIIERTRRTHRTIAAAVRSRAPDVRFRITGCDRGDAGITLFTRWPSAEAAREAAAVIKAGGVTCGMSSNMTLLPNVDYVREGLGLHARIPQVAEQIAAASQFETSAKLLDVHLPIAISPRFQSEHVELIVECIVRAAQEVGGRATQAIP